MTPTRPCPICGHELAPRTILLRDWLLHPFRSLYRRRYDASYAAWHMLLNHGESTTLHELSPATYANWSQP